MPESSYRFLDFPAYIDESIDSLEDLNPFYVMSAVIFFGELENAQLEFHKADLNLGFKTSNHSTVRKQAKLRSYGSWMAGQDFIAICVAIPLTSTSQEVLRRISLTHLFEHLNLLGIEEFKMDSRDELSLRKRHLNIYDQSTLEYLKRTNSGFSRSKLTFHNDREDFRFSMTDFVAWNARRHLGRTQTNYVNYLRNRLEIFVLSEQESRPTSPLVRKLVDLE